MCDPESLYRASRGYVEASAGCGKTRLIAAAVARHADGCELILTHTHAGVNAIRRYLRELEADPKRYSLSTIDGLALLVASSYPRASEIDATRPPSGDEWGAVNLGAARALEIPAIVKAIEASFSGVLVDEYQDCSVQQHRLICSLTEHLPVRILGDPLQGIFDFRGNEPIDWDECVAGEFEELPSLETPWRWKNANRELGEWLSTVRELIKDQAPIDLRHAPRDSVEWVQIGIGSAEDAARQQRVCRREANPTRSVVGVFEMMQRCRKLASRLRGLYFCAERVDCPDLLVCARDIDEGYGIAKVQALVDLFSKCTTKIAPYVSDVVIRVANGEELNPAGFGEKKRPYVQLITEAAQDDGLIALGKLADQLECVAEASFYRREPIWDIKTALAAVAAGEHESVHDAAWSIRDRLRRNGRSYSRNVLGTTKLVKGLQFDVAILLDADKLEPRDLYVALTRPATKLVVLSAKPVLEPAYT